MRARRPLLVAAALVAVLGPSLPASADPSPSNEDLRKADQRVAAARHRVASLQALAEQAAEEYNGARIRAAKAEAASTNAATAARAAQAVYATASARAQAAQAVADAAAAAAHDAEVASAAAQAAADEAQALLDRIAVGAFQSGGQLGMVSQLFMADDPLELANSRNLMNHVGVYQDQVIAAAVAARNAADAAEQRAHAAETEAAGKAALATKELDRAGEARDKAEAAHQSALGAANEAVQARRAAGRARTRALALVAQAERALGRAVRTKAQLEAEARAARADASKYSDVDAPSDEARIAIHWAFEEIGVPYSWGGGDENGPTYGFAQGAGTKGFDCSGLTLFAYAKAGIHLDHYTHTQWNQGKRVSSRSELLPGDLMFFAYDTSRESTIHHVAIYIGKGRMIEAPYTGEVVRVTSASRDDYIGAVRPWA
jgi:cell wall-associated NlpC family hydrolase